MPMTTPACWTVPSGYCKHRSGYADFGTRQGGREGLIPAALFHDHIVIQEQQHRRSRFRRGEVVHAGEIERPAIGEIRTAKALDAFPHLFTVACFEMMHHHDLECDARSFA